MLTITRKLNEAFIIETPGGETADVVVSRIRGKQVSLTISAPDRFKILREELRRPRVKLIKIEKE